MTTTLTPVPKIQFFDANGNPLVGGKLYTYAAGTTTPLTSYTDSTGVTANTNPVIMDSRGEASVWLGDNLYKLKLTSATGDAIWTVDNIDGRTVIRAAQLAASNGSSLVGYIGGGVGTVATTVQAKLRQYVSVKDYGATGNGSTDDTNAIKAAVAASSGASLYFPPGTYLVSDKITLLANSYVYGDPGQSIIKLKSGSYSTLDVSLFLTEYVTNVHIFGLTFNGNKGNVGTSRNPINTVYQATNITYDTCTFVSCEGICLNVSTTATTFKALNCRFISCGGATDNSDGYRKQGIAFSNSTGTFTTGVEITGCYFYAQGLDCISLSNCQNVVIADNIAEDSYTFLFNTPAPQQSRNLTVTGNSIYNTNQGSLNNAVNPVAIDLPRVVNATITGNSIYNCEQAAIGVFDDSDNVLVANNTIVNAVTKPVSWCGAISVGANGAASGINWVTIANNIITGATATMTYGILLQGDLDTAFISNNSIVGASVSKYGRYTAGLTPSPANATALTDNSGVSTSTLIQDVTAGSGIWTNWRITNTLESYNVDGVKVVGNQQSAIPNSGNATTDAILAALRAHGLIAT